jgi:hypothetical protein
MSSLIIRIFIFPDLKGTSQGYCPLSVVDWNGQCGVIQCLKNLSVSIVRFKAFTAVTMKNAVFWDIKFNSYLTGNTLRLSYRAQLFNAM